MSISLNSSAYVITCTCLIKTKTLDMNDVRQIKVTAGVDLLAADHLVAVVFLGQLSEGWLNDTTTQTQNQMQGGF